LLLLWVLLLLKVRLLVLLLMPADYWRSWLLYNMLWWRL
jgi:hypothetical protein